MYRIHHNGTAGEEDFKTETDALAASKELIASGLARRVEVYKLCKVVASEMKITVTTPGVVPQGEICGNS